MNQKRQRQDFTDEFKKDAVSLVTEQGYSCTEVARRLGINHTNVSRWVRHHRDQLAITVLKNPIHCEKLRMRSSDSGKKTNAF